MANRRDYYFEQEVTEAELDDGFNGLEQAIFNVMVDAGVVGVLSGMSVAQHAGTPNLTVDIAEGVAYDENGQRIFVPGPTQNQTVATDQNNASTAVVSGGHERWVSVFAKFSRVLSDPRVDGNSSTVYFRRDEGYELVVVQGAEAATGFAVKPSLDGSMILLADVHRTFGQTQILNADIDIGRRQDVFVLNGPPGGLSIRAGTLVGAVSAMLDDLNNHILGISGEHPASAITYGGGVAWADGTTNPSTDVESQLDKILSDLATTSGSGGAARIGDGAVSGATYSLSGGTLHAHITTIVGWINAFASTTGDGASLIGTSQAGLLSIAGTTVRAQLDYLANNWLNRVTASVQTINGKATWLSGWTSSNTNSMASPAVTTALMESTDVPAVADATHYRLISQWYVEALGGGGGGNIYVRHYVRGDGALVIAYNMHWTSGTTWVADATAVDGKLVIIGGTGDKAYVAKYFVAPQSATTDDVTDCVGILQGQIDSAGGHTTTVNSNGLTSPTASIFPFKLAGHAGGAETWSTSVTFGHRFPSNPSSLAFSSVSTTNCSTPVAAGGSTVGSAVDVAVTGAGAFSASATLTVS